MNYRNAEMKIDQLVSYLNEEKINLSPAFQRGHVWTLTDRRKLLRNIVLGKPIPAIFLYKEATGSRYSYNILDGKQRLESLILFIADKRPDVKISRWQKYFFGPTYRAAAHFAVELGDGSRRQFQALGDEVVREFREYSIPTIEISLDDDSSLDEIITLFVDINQQGEAVKRFDIVKAMCKSDPLLKSVFSLLAVEQRRGQDIHYKAKSNEFTAVLRRLQVVDRISAGNSKIDKMWEKLLEVALFVRTKVHRKSVDILKEFIAGTKKSIGKLTPEETKQLRILFEYIKGESSSLGTSRLYTDQTHSYTLLTSIVRANLIGSMGVLELSARLKAFASCLDSPATAKAARVPDEFKRYLELSTRQTTDASRRQERDTLFVTILGMLPKAAPGAGSL